MANPTSNQDLSHRIRQSVAGVIEYNRTTAGRSLATFPLDLANEAATEIERLRAALSESVKLQSHYAGLLNMQDGGQRMTFQSVEEWLKRLAALSGDGSPFETFADCHECKAKWEMHHDQYCGSNRRRPGEVGGGLPLETSCGCPEGFCAYAAHGQPANGGRCKRDTENGGADGD